MDTIREILQWLTLHLKELFLYIGGITIGGISIWKLLSIIIALIRKSTKKKYLREIERRESELNKRFDLLEEKLTNTIVGEVDKCATKFANSFNYMEQRKIEEKQKIYRKHFHRDMEVKEIVDKPEVKEEQKSEPVEIEQVPVVEEVVEKPQIEEEPQKKVDLL